MVYRKRRYRKKRPSLAKTVAKIIASKVEVKDATQLSSGGVTSTGTMFPLLTAGILAQGPSSDQRIGNEIMLLSTKLSIMCSQADSPYNRVRYAVLKCRQRPTNVASLFNNTSYTAFGGIFANWNYDVIERVYLDRTMMLRAASSSGASNASVMTTKFAKHHLKTKDKLHFQSNLSGPQESWYFFVISDSAPASLIHPNVDVLLNHRFTDQ